MKFYNCFLFSALLALLPEVGAQDECAIDTTTGGTTEESTGDCPEFPTNFKSCKGFVPSDGSGPIDIYTIEECSNECTKFSWTSTRWTTGDRITEEDGMEYLALRSQCQCYNATTGTPEDGVTLCADDRVLHAIPAPLESCTDDGVNSEAECVSKCQELFPWLDSANYPTTGQCSDPDYIACQCNGSGGAGSRPLICSNCTDPTDPSGATTIFTTRDGSATMFVVMMMFAGIPWLVAHP